MITRGLGGSRKCWRGSSYGEEEGNNMGRTWGLDRGGGGGARFPYQPKAIEPRKEKLRTLSIITLIHIQDTTTNNKQQTTWMNMIHHKHTLTHFSFCPSLSLSLSDLFCFVNKYCCLWSVDNLCVVCSLCCVCVSPNFPILTLSLSHPAAAALTQSNYTLWSLDQSQTIMLPSRLYNKTPYHCIA